MRFQPRLSEQRLLLPVDLVVALLYLVSALELSLADLLYVHGVGALSKKLVI